MPLFRRHDADLVHSLQPMRRIMPYLMRTRNESAVFHDSTYRMAAILAWLAASNQTHAVHATVFDVFLYACGQALHLRPEMNRFVSGGRLYQRRGVQISFVVKRAMSDRGGETTVKLEIARGESLAAFVARASRAIADARIGRDRGPGSCPGREAAGPGGLVGSRDGTDPGSGRIAARSGTAGPRPDGPQAARQTVTGGRTAEAEDLEDRPARIRPLLERCRLRPKLHSWERIDHD